MQKQPARAKAVRCGGPRCLRDTSALDHHLRRLEARRLRVVQTLAGDQEDTGRRHHSRRKYSDSTAQPAAACACNSPTLRAPAEKPLRSVSGDWLARSLRLQQDLSRQLAGVDVLMDEDAWGALRASLEMRQRWKATRRDVKKRRAKIWSETSTPQGQHSTSQIVAKNLFDASTATEQPFGLNERSACACDVTYEAATRWVSGARYVDSLFGDDANPGTVSLELDTTTGGWRMRVRPWKSLRRVEYWLNVELWERSFGVPGAWSCVSGAEVYLRRGRTWDGSEEPSQATTRWEDAPEDPFDWAAPELNALGEQVIFAIDNFHATEDGPLIISCYPPPESSGQSADFALLPLIDGVEGSEYGAPYRDDRRGIVLTSCCHVSVSNVRIRGFGAGVQALQASKDILFQNLRVSDCTGTGIGCGIGDAAARLYYGWREDLEDEQKDALIEEMLADGFYVDDVIIHECSVSSVGYDSSHQDIGIGYLATNVTVTNCKLTGDDVRGVDGILFNGASSGHLIEGNEIGGHNRFCRVSSSIKAVYVSGSSDWILVHPCDEFRPDTLFPSMTIGTPYGYDQRYISSSSWPTMDDTTTAHGEDGIDLKGVRKRTPTARDGTHICSNVIYGHKVFNGIAVSDSSQNVHIYRNRIFQNQTGIAVANGAQITWFNYGKYYESPVSEVYIYRNLIYMNLGRGIYVEGRDDKVAENPDVVAHLEIDGVYIIGNTIAHNLWEGMEIVEADSGGGVRNLCIFNNLIARNGYQYRLRQVRFDPGLLPYRSLVGFLWSDFNCYLGWDNSAASTPTDTVLGVGGVDRTVAETTSAYGIEEHGSQATFLSDLDLDDERLFESLEGKQYLATPDYLEWGVDIVANVTTADAASLETASYAMSSSSICVDAGTSVPSSYLLISFSLLNDVANSDDFNQASIDAAPDCGALEE